MKTVSVFDFNNLKDLLKYQIDQSLIGRTGRKTSNLSKIARALGYRSPSILTMLVKGQRIPSDDMIDAMIRIWNLNNEESAFLRLLVQVERDQKKGRNTTELFSRLNKLATNKNAFTFSLNQFSLIQHWYFLVIKQMIDSPDFVEDPQWISRKLQKKITPGQALRAIEIMLDMSILKRDPLTSKLMTNVGYTETEHEMPSEAVRMHHKGMIERAVESLENDPPERRHFNSLTLAIDPKDVPMLKEKLLTFIRQFNTDFQSEGSNRVYQLNVQFFEHTRGDEGDRKDDKH